MEQWTSLKWAKEYIKAVCCHLACLTYIQNTSCKMPGWMNHNKEPLDEGEKDSGKAGLKLNIQNLRSWHLVSSLHGKSMGRKMETVTDYFLGLQNHCRW